MNEQLPGGPVGSPPGDPVEKRRRFIVNFVYFLILFALSVLLVRYALSVLAPFVIAFLVSLLLKPFVRLVAEKFHFSERATALTTVLLFYLIVCVILLIPVISVIHWVVSNIGRVPEYFFQTIVPGFTPLADRAETLLETFSEDLSIDIRSAFSNALASIGTHLTNLSGTIATKTLSIASSVPSILLNIVVMVISTVFILMDFDMLRGFLRHQLPEKIVDRINTARDHLGKLLRKYIASYALIMFITFCEILVGLLIIGVKRSWLIAMLVAVFDILPVVGSGLVLMPWAIICVFTGSIGRGIGLVILWVIVTIIRNIIEPKIVGSTVGMHPLVTLLAMILGNFIYGGIGILLLPIGLALCQSLNNEGIIHLYKPYEEPESEDPGKKSKLFIWTSRLFDRLGVLFCRFGRWIADLFRGKKKKGKRGRKSDDGWDGK